MAVQWGAWWRNLVTTPTLLAVLGSAWFDAGGPTRALLSAKPAGPLSGRRRRRFRKPAGAPKSSGDGNQRVTRPYDSSYLPPLRSAT